MRQSKSKENFDTKTHIKQEWKQTDCDGLAQGNNRLAGQHSAGHHRPQPRQRHLQLQFAARSQHNRIVANEKKEEFSVVCGLHSIRLHALVTSRKDESAAVSSFNASTSALGDPFCMRNDTPTTSLTNACIELFFLKTDF